MQLLAVKTCVQKCTSTPPARGDLLTINVFQTMSVLLAGCPLCLLSCLGFNVVSLCLSANSSCLKKIQMLCFQSGLMFWAVNFNGFRFLSGVRLTAPCLRNLVRSHWWDDQEHHGVLKCCWCAATCRLLCYFEYWNQIATISFAPDMYCFIPNTCFTGTFFFSVVLLLRPWWYWFYIYIHIYIYIYYVIVLL